MEKYLSFTFAVVAGSSFWVSLIVLTNEVMLAIVSHYGK
jgi:hypothetical protein